MSLIWTTALKKGLYMEIIAGRILHLTAITTVYFSSSTSKLVPWNPSTKQYRILLPCPLNETKRGRFYTCRAGLGYDSAADDYKVVLIVHGVATQAWMFGMKSNMWTRTDLGSFPYASKHGWSRSAYFAHGNLHWLYQSTGSRTSFPRLSFHDQKIITFNVASRKFSHVAQPVYPTEGCMTGLHVLDGCLCVSFFPSSRAEKALLYVMEKDGDDYTWRMLCSFTSRLPPFLDIGLFKNVKVVGYSEEGDKIVMHVGLKFMVSYDLKGKCFERIEVAPSGCANGRRPVMFTESLVSVGPGAISNTVEP